MRKLTDYQHVIDVVYYKYKKMFRPHEEDFLQDLWLNLSEIRHNLDKKWLKDKDLSPLLYRSLERRTIDLIRSKPDIYFVPIQEHHIMETGDAINTSDFKILLSQWLSLKSTKSHKIILNNLQKALEGIPIRSETRKRYQRDLRKFMKKGEYVS